MKILFFGDIVGQLGRQALAKILPELKKETRSDLVIVNGDNVAHGQGLTQRAVQEVISAGVDFLTGGDHAFVLKEAIAVLEAKTLPVLRPYNWPGMVPGRGFEIIPCGARRILLVSLIGRVFMRQDFDDPFQKISALLEDYSLKGQEQGSEAVDAILIDFHAEATSEKAALAWFLDGKVSAVLGTHTHVPTADEKILLGGSAFISDLGMVGPVNSVLGAEKENVIKRFLTQRMIKNGVATGAVEINGICLTLDERSGLAQNIERIRKIIDLE